MAMIVNDIQAVRPIVEYAKSQLQRPEADVFRVTSLIGPPLVRTLAIKHWDEIKVDLSTLLPAMEGTAWHAKMEQYSPEKSISRQRFVIKLRNVLVTGEPDLFGPERGLLSDFKLVRVWAWIFDNDWEEQLNLYKLLLETGCRAGTNERTGYQVNKAFIRASFKDWSELGLVKANASRKKYPPARHINIPIPLWSRKKATAYLNERLTDHLDNPERECTKKEKWNNALRCRAWCFSRNVCPYNNFKDEPKESKGD